MENVIESIESVNKNTENVIDDYKIVIGSGNHEIALKNKYRKIYEISAEIEDLDKEVTFYFKAPNNISLNRCTKNMSKKHIQAQIEFAKDNIIDEQAKELEKICEEYPGIAVSLAGKLFALMGFTDNVVAKKL